MLWVGGVGSDEAPLGAILVQLLLTVTSILLLPRRPTAAIISVVKTLQPACNQIQRVRRQGNTCCLLCCARQMIFPIAPVIRRTEGICLDQAADRIRRHHVASFLCLASRALALRTGNAQVNFGLAAFWFAVEVVRVPRHNTGHLCKLCAVLVRSGPCHYHAACKSIRKRSTMSASACTAYRRNLQQAGKRTHQRILSKSNEPCRRPSSATCKDVSRAAEPSRF